MTKSRNPWVGLRPFEFDESYLFFGRDKEVQILQNLILTLPVLIIYGPSGTGKSSIINAGLGPHFNEQEDHFVVTVGPREDVLETTRLAYVGSGTQQQSPSDVGGMIKARWLNQGRRTVIFLDQFEERFNANESLDELYTTIAKLVHSGSDAACFVISLREDYLGNLEPLMRRIPGLLNMSYRVPPLMRPALESAVYGPLAKAGGQFTVEDRLVSRVLNDLEQRTTQGQEPGEQRFEPGYFQIIWMTLWEHCERSKHFQISISDYEHLGGAAQILKDFTANILGALEPALSNMFWAISRYLVLPTGAKVALTVEDLTSLLQPSDYLSWSPDKYNSPSKNWLALLDSERSAALIQQVFYRLTASQSPLFQRVIRADREEYELLHDLLGGILLAWREERRREDVQRVSERTSKMEDDAAAYRDYIGRKLQDADQSEPILVDEFNRLTTQVDSVTRKLETWIDVRGSTGDFAEEVAALQRLTIETGWLKGNHFRLTRDSENSSGLIVYRAMRELDEAVERAAWSMCVIALEHPDPTWRIPFQNLMDTWSDSLTEPAPRKRNGRRLIVMKVTAAGVLGVTSVGLSAALLQPLTRGVVSYIEVTLVVLGMGAAFSYGVAIFSQSGSIGQAVKKTILPIAKLKTKGKSGRVRRARIVLTWPFPSFLVLVIATLLALVTSEYGAPGAVGYNLGALLGTILVILAVAKIADA